MMNAMRTNEKQTNEKRHMPMSVSAEAGAMPGPERRSG